MKFSIEYTGKSEDRLLTYSTEGYAFDIDPVVQWVSFDLAINMISLTVVDYCHVNKVVQVWGYCPHGGWLPTDHNVPIYAPGELRVLENLEPGFTHSINKEGEWPVYVNQRSGWVCIGSLTKSGDAVEFINNCVAVVGSKQNLTALWLKPQSLPKLVFPASL